MCLRSGRCRNRRFRKKGGADAPLIFVFRELIFVSNGDSLDWKEQGADAEINQVLNHKHLGNGSIILFHNDAKYTPQVLDTILKGLKEKGYEIVPVSELILRDNFEMDHEGRQILKG